MSSYHELERRVVMSRQDAHLRGVELAVRSALLAALLILFSMAF